jgi:hypothetical protein
VITKRDAFVGRVERVATAGTLLTNSNMNHISNEEKELANKATKALAEWSKYLHDNL